MLMIQHMKASLRAVVPKETPEAAIERTLEMRE